MFTHETVTVSGIETAVLTAGSGDPVVYFHGSSTAPGFDHLAPLARRNRLIVPLHPGFGDSAGDESIDSASGYVMHYIELFDLLGLRDICLVGQSLGGLIAARFAISHADRLRRLVLCAPIGLRVPEAPTTDLFSVPPSQLPAMLTTHPERLAVPDITDTSAMVAAYRETVSTARVLWVRNWDPLLARWLGRIRVPTLLLWGAEDRMVPPAQAEAWARRLPQAQVTIIPGCGHLLLAESTDTVGQVAAFCSQSATAPAR